MHPRPAISVFTPSHDPRFLAACCDSLLGQSFTDWEWIVLLNNGARWDPPADDRIRVEVDSSSGASVGALKRRAVELCDGELLVELDHDDLLTPDALDRLMVRYLNRSNRALYYSDCAQIDVWGNGDASMFDVRHGWEYHRQTAAGRDVLVVDALEPTPHNVSNIWYAPNHLRAFPRWAYDQAGGYNASLEVCDDLDLMTRLYRVGPFEHIPRCLYLQRVHPENTQTLRNAKIQAETLRMYDQNIEGNALAWAKRAGLACLDLGGAHNSPPGYTSVDIAAGADIRAEVISHLLVVDESSVGVIRAQDFLEHVSESVWLMNLIHRALAPNGLLLSCTPSTDGRGAFQDPTHVSFWNENSFWYYTRADQQRYVPAITGRFQVSRLVTYFPSQWHHDHDIPYVQANLIALKDEGFRDGGILDW